MTAPYLVDYDEKQAGDLIVVEAPNNHQPIPPGWTDLTWNRGINPRITVYRVHCHGDQDAHDLWGKDALIVAVRGIRYAVKNQADTWTPTIPPT